MARGKMAVVGVPSAAAARGPGVAQAPFALREHGLLEALASPTLRVVNLSDLSLFPFRADAPDSRARNAEGVACALRATADEMGRALAEGFTLVLGGDCTIAAGVLGGARSALGRPVGLVYLDANADLNTPETSPSGFLNGMALSLALGRGPREVVHAAGSPPWLAPDHVSLMGYRSLDAGERLALGDLGLALPAAAARGLGMKASCALALDGVGNEDGPVVVHLDVDLVDPREMTAKDALTPGAGLAWDEASDLLSGLLASPRVVALFVAEYNPLKDPAGVQADALVAMIGRAVARHFRS